MEMEERITPREALALTVGTNTHKTGEKRRRESSLWGCMKFGTAPRDGDYSGSNGMNGDTSFRNFHFYNLMRCDVMGSWLEEL